MWCSGESETQFDGGPVTCARVSDLLLEPSVGDGFCWAPTAADISTCRSGAPKVSSLGTARACVSSSPPTVVRPRMALEAVRTDADQGEHGFGRPALVVVSMAVALVMAQQLMLSLAIPAVTADLGATAAQMQWILNVYPIGLAALLLTGGALGDRYGRRKVLLVGLAIMAMANLANACTDSVTGVIVARGVCAIGAALVFPATLSTLTVAYRESQRTKAIAVWSIAAILGAFGGIFVVGLLLEFWTWRSTFWASTVVSLALLPAVRLVVPESRSPNKAKLDFASSSLACVGVGATTFGIIAAGEHGIFDARVVLGVLAGLASCSLFARRQWRAESPLLNIRALTSPTAGIGLIGTTAMYFIAYATAVIAIQYLSVVQGQTALQVGTTMLAYATLLIPLTFASTRIAARFGSGPPIVVGMVVVAGSYVGLSTLGSRHGLASFILWAIMFGAGFGLMQAPAIECIVSALPPAEQGLASALNDITRELGAALGIAVSLTVFTANVDEGAAPAEGLMAAWIPTCFTLSGAALLAAAGIGLLHRRVTIPANPGGRGTAHRYENRRTRRAF